MVLGEKNICSHYWLQTRLVTLMWLRKFSHQTVPNVQNAAYSNRHILRRQNYACSLHPSIFNLLSCREFLGACKFWSPYSSVFWGKGSACDFFGRCFTDGQGLCFPALNRTEGCATFAQRWTFMQIWRVGRCKSKFLNAICSANYRRLQKRGFL